MHFEVLVEDQSGKKLLEIVLPKIAGMDHTFRVISYKGIGRIPTNLRGTSDPNRRILLDRLPAVLRGYGKSYSQCDDVVILLVCDLDSRCHSVFLSELKNVLNACDPQPNASFCLAIEEGEAWLLGDVNAIKKAYPRAKDGILTNYKNDSICGTWETLADAVFTGGAAALRSKSYSDVGREKTNWAESVSPHMNVDDNKSPSFRHFRETVRRLATK